jgi:hypothetical protein
MNKISLYIFIIIFSTNSYAQLSSQDSITIKNHYWNIHSYFPSAEEYIGEYGYTNMHSGAYLSLNEDSSFYFEEYWDFLVEGRPTPSFKGNYFVKDDTLRLLFTEYQLDSTASLEYVDYMMKDKANIIQKMILKKGTYLFKTVGYYIFLILPSQKELFLLAAFTPEGIPPINYFPKFTTGVFPIFLKQIKNK